MEQAIKQLLKEIKSIDQECIDLNKWNFENRNGFIKRLEWRLEFALKEGKQSKDRKQAERIVRNSMPQVVKDVIDGKYKTEKD